MILSDISLALKDKSLAENITPEEMNSLVNRYPIASKLRSLRLKRNMESFSQNNLNELSLSSFSSPTRSVIESLFSFPDKEEIITEKNEMSSIETSVIDTESQKLDEAVEDENLDTHESVHDEIVQNETSAISGQKTVSEESSIKDVVPELGHLSDYSSWLLQLQQTDETEKEDFSKDQVELQEAADVSIVDKIDAKTDKSSELNQEIVSESLANLLADQGHSKKAKEMYTKLSLIFPEKSAYFAAQIEKIKGK